MTIRATGETYFQQNIQKWLGRLPVIYSISSANLENRFKIDICVKSITSLLCLSFNFFFFFIWLTVFLSKITTSKLKSLRKSFVGPTVHSNVTSTKTTCFEWRAWSWWYWPMQVWALHKKWSFPLRISPVNVTKSAGNCAFGHIYRINP